jgi:hypothetical protein
MADFLTDYLQMLGEFATACIQLALTHMDYSIPAALVVALALYWRETGRFPIVGAIVRLLWLPLNLLCGVLWIIGGVLNLILRFMDIFTNLKPALLFFVLILSFNDARFFILLAGLFFLFWQGIDTERLRYGMNYYPRAKRTPERPAPRAKVEKPKPAPKLPQRKESAPIPPPLVTIAAAARGRVHNEQELIQLLPPHLGQLIASAAPAPSDRRRPSWLKPFLRRLLLFPFWLLLLPVKLLTKSKQQPAQAIPATSEAGNE